jgi:hypothetical protein
MWWKDIFGKAIPMFITEMKDDERQVKKDELGNFINVFIRRSELEGKIGSIELEANENLPITWNQQKDAIMELFQLNNENVLQVLGSVDNLPLIRKAIGLTDFVIPGEDDRQKQYEEIQLLVNSEPIEIPVDPMQAQLAMQQGQPSPEPQRVPSIEIDFDIDNHVLEADICRRWLVGPAGRQCKLENPAGYENVLLHFKMHRDANSMMQQMALNQQIQQEAQMRESQIQTEQQGAMGPPPQSTGVPIGVGENEPTIQ